jgi:hypothetical protein
MSIKTALPQAQPARARIASVFLIAIHISLRDIYRNNSIEALLLANYILNSLTIHGSFAILIGVENCLF